MAELIDMQAMIYDSIVKLGINIKKDGVERKTLDYFKRRLNTLEEYWTEYQGNHDRISGEVSQTNSYFVNREREKTMKAYEEVKALINQQYQKFLSKTANPIEQGRSPYKTAWDAPQPEEVETTAVAGPSSQTHILKTSTGTNSKVDDLLRRQQANFKAFLRTTSNIDIDSISEKWEFEDVLKTLEARWSTIDTLHWEIESELDEENVSYNCMFDKYEKQFSTLKKSINKKMWSVVHRNKATPQFEIPVFSGNYHQWVSFRDLFTEAIHSNSSLSNGQKMQYLKSKVRGEAEKLIQHMQISAENYLSSWDILMHRYNNKKLIFSSQINILLNLPNIHQQSVHLIKRMHDTTVECLNGIKNLGVDITSWDPIVVHILAQKLDNETYTDYIESLKNSRELPVLQEFLEFLETKFTTLETAYRKTDHGSSKGSPTKHNNSSSNVKKSYYNLYNNYNNMCNNPNKSVAKSMYVTNIKCPMCKSQHGIYNCKTYLALSDELKLKTANKLKLCTNCLFSHNGNKCNSTLTCRKCQEPHNTILHDALTKQSRFGHSSRNQITQQEQENFATTSHTSQIDTSEILLATALLQVKATDGSYYTMRALVDQGSQISLITEKAAQLLNIKRQRCKGVIFGVGQKESNCKGVISIECASLCNNYTFKAEVFIMTNLIKSLPNQSFPKPDWSHIANIQLADPEFYKSRPVDLLLGADIYANIILSGIIKSGNSYQPLVQQTQLGWLLCGNVKTYQCNVVLNNLDEIKRFWQVEEISEPSDLSQEDQECLTFYESTTRRTDEGRYEVRIPLKEDLKHKLGSSKPMAIAQLKNLENRFNKQKQLACKYRSFMSEYLQLQHMKPEETNTTASLQCYLPHHGVQRDESLTTKLRVVFNASAKTSTKFSLNDIMHKGPNMQKDLQSLLIQWRQYPYAFTADIEKMYRQILLNSIDQPLHKIVWRESPEQPIQSFQLTTVTYGTKAAPFLLSLAPYLEQRSISPETSTQTTTTTEKEPFTLQSKKSTRRRRANPVNLSNIVMALTFFMTLCGCVSGTYNITQFGTEQSLFFDPLGKLSLAKDKWTLVIFYDMSPYWEGIKAYNKIITYLDTMGKTIGGEHCNTITAQLLHEANELKYYNQLLLTQQSGRHSRRRRGLINGIGYLAHSLFGVLDEHFAEKYTRDINLIRNNEKHIVKLWKNQTSIIESEYNLLQRTTSIMNKQHKIINQHLMKLYNRTNELQQQINNISLVQEYTLMSLTASNLLRNLKGSQDTLVDILSNIHHGQFNMHLLTPEQLQTELNTISAHLSDDTMLPIDPLDIRELYPLLHLKARLTENYFLFEITFPLIGRDTFKLYRIIPIPHQVESSMMELIPTSEYIATDLKRSTYITFTSEDLALCNKLKTWICDFKKPVYHQRSDLKFCDLEVNTEKCRVKRSRCENRWEPLNNPSHYLFHCCDTCQVNILCGEQISVEQLSQSGVINIEPGCLLKGHEFTLHVPKNTENKLRLSSSVYSPEIDQMNFLMNTSMMWANLSKVTESSDIVVELNKLHQRIEEMKNSSVEMEDSLSSHDVHLYAVSYILVGAGFVAAGTLWCRRWQRMRAHGARISPDIELQPTVSVVSSACVADRQPSVQVISESARLDMGHRRPNPDHIYGVINKCAVKDQSCSPMPRKHLELRPKNIY